MKTRTKIAIGIAAILAIAFLFVDLSFLPARTYAIYIHPDITTGIEEGSAVLKSGIQIGSVRHVQLTDDGQISVELGIRKGYVLRESDICVIHRLHRYDQPTLQIESTPGNLDTLPEGAILNCVIANGAWPEIPGAFAESES